MHMTCLKGNGTLTPAWHKTTVQPTDRPPRLPASKHTHFSSVRMSCEGVSIVPLLQMYQLILLLTG